jgi:hypothetical protein
MGFIISHEIPPGEQYPCSKRLEMDAAAKIPSSKATCYRKIARN